MFMSEPTWSDSVMKMISIVTFIFFCFTTYRCYMYDYRSFDSVYDQCNANGYIQDQTRRIECKPAYESKNKAS